MEKHTFQTEISLAVHSKPVLCDFSILCIVQDKKCFCVTLLYIDLLAKSGFSKLIFQPTLSTKQKILDIHYFTVLHPQLQLLAKMNVLSYAYVHICIYMCLLESPSFELSIGGISGYDLLLLFYCA